MELQERTLEITDPRYSPDLYYKYLYEDGSAIYGKGKWALPASNEAGEWMPAIEGELIACQNGYHACRENDLLGWEGQTLYVIEFDEDPMLSQDKVVGRCARLLYRLDNWNEKNQRLFAADCAERTLHICERCSPQDHRPRQAVEAARRYTRGEISDEELAAARDAAWDAARATARDAAWAAAWATAWATAWDAAWAAERAWQRQRFLEYVWGARS